MAQGSGLTRGDRNRNRKLEALREAVRRDRAILAIDLGEDKQVAVVMDHEGKVLGRKTVTAKAHQLGGLIEWAAGIAGKKAGLEGLTVACEPAGHRWKALMGLADAAGHGFVCVQSMAVHRARETDDCTPGKTGHRDAYLIGKLVTRLECCLPERADERRARLRHLGARRSGLVTELAAARQQAGDLLGCAWPAALGTAAKPLEAVTWMAAMAVITARCAGHPERLRKIGCERFLAAVRRELPRWDGKKPRHSIVKGLRDALTSAEGVAAQRPGAVERLELVMEDWRDLRRKLAGTEDRMLAVLDEPGLAELAASIDGMSPLSAAAILAECGGPRRFASARALVRHAGLNPSEHSSATMNGQARISRRGRPGLRTAAWRAVWGALRGNAVLRARYAHLTSRDANRLADGQARTACAAALLRWLWAVITTGRAWDRAAAAGETAARPALPAAA